MSICSPCYDSGSYVDVCATGLTFGVAQPDTSYLVCIQYKATGRIQTFVSISDEFGNITIEGVLIDPLQGYTLWITTDTPNGTRQDLTIGADTYTCIDFSIAVSDAEPSIVNLTNE
jgi:hypothetical protein